MAVTEKLVISGSRNEFPIYWDEIEYRDGVKKCWIARCIPALMRFAAKTEYKVRDKFKGYFL